MFMLLIQYKYIFALLVNWALGLDKSVDHFVPYNGGISETQLEFLKRELEMAQREKERVVLFNHVPVCKVRGIFILDKLISLFYVE
jgi:hypothetical protein